MVSESDIVGGWEVGMVDEGGGGGGEFGVVVFGVRLGFGVWVIEGGCDGWVVCGREVVWVEMWVVYWGVYIDMSGWFGCMFELEVGVGCNFCDGGVEGILEWFDGLWWLVFFLI